MSEVTLAQQVAAGPAATTRSGGALCGLAALGLGLLILGPALVRGFVLSYDMVFVPDPPSNAPMFGLTGGFPRQVPSDAVVAALAVVLPADIVQKLILLAIFALAGWGAARLLGGLPLAARLTTAIFYSWNPFVAERLLLGQWALLLGYAGLPWALAAAVAVAREERGGVARLVRAALPAAVGGFAAMNLTALVAAGALVTSGGRRLRAGVRIGGVLAGLALPWLVPALAVSGATRTDSAGVDLFAARADTPFGALGSLISLGGIWNAEVVPPGYGAWAGAAGRLALSIAAIVAFWLAVRGARRGVRLGLRDQDWAAFRGLALPAAGGLAIAALGITEPGRWLLGGLIGLWPGFGALRDAQLYVAPLALVQAVGLGLGVAALARTGRAGELGVLIAIAPIAVLPTLAWGISGRLDTVEYPGDWDRARTIIDGDPAPGRVLALPWGAYRRFGWNAERTVLDPLPRTLARRVVWNDGLRVGTRALAMEDPLARTVDGLIRAPGSLTAPLAEAGYRYVVLEKVDQPETAGYRQRLAGARPVLDGSDLLVFQVPRAARATDVTREPGGPPVAAVMTAGSITFLLVLWAFGTYAHRLRALRGYRPPGRTP